MESFVNPKKNLKDKKKLVLYKKNTFFRIVFQSLRHFLREKIP